MSTQEPSPPYRSMLAGADAVEAVAGRTCEATPEPTEARPPTDTPIAVITAATGRDRALHSTLISPPPGTRVARIYPLRTPRSIGLTEFLRGIPSFPCWLGEAELDRGRESLLEVLSGVLLGVQGLGHLDQDPVRVPGVDEGLAPVWVLHVDHDQLDPTRAHPLDLRAEVRHRERHVVDPLPPLLQEPRHESLADRRDELHLAASRETVLDEAKPLVVVVAEHGELRAENVAKELRRLGGVVHRDGDVVEGRPLHEWQLF